MPRTDFRTARSVIPAILLLGTMLAFGFERSRSTREDGAYLTAVYQAITDIPYRIGGWIGVDVEAQAPAIQLLRPNKLLQRSYMTADGASTFSLLFIHCSDARDMQGHYPPICYPAHGWTMVESTRTDCVLGQSAVPCVVYRCSTVHNGEELRMTILNFFAVPSHAQALAADMSAVNSAAASSTRSGLGAAQIQLIVPRDAEPAELVRLMQEIGPAIEPAVWRVIHGVAIRDN